MSAEGCGQRFVPVGNGSLWRIPCLPDTCDSQVCRQQNLNAQRARIRRRKKRELLEINAADKGAR